jgi:hypothetical protein
METRGRSFLLFPHPSGRSRWWNEPTNQHDAGMALRRFLR